MELFLILKERKDKDFLNAALKRREYNAVEDARAITTIKQKSGMRPIQSATILGLMVANIDYKISSKIVNFISWLKAKSY